MLHKVKILDGGDEIVITGMSGKFPNSKNVKELEYNLYNKVSMVDDLETRWKHMYPGIPRTFGKIPFPTKFDSTFFGIHKHQADQMDFQMRILMEESYKAVMDAGVNPSSLRNSNTGVYIANCTNETDKDLMYSDTMDNSHGLLGSSKSLFANRISFVMGLNGPSLACDTACSSSMYALNIAYEHMANGIIDAAIVGGANAMICPFVTAKFAKLGVLSMTGNCRPFDEDANGYVRSEAIACVFLQRKRDAKRIYATLIHSSTNCDGFKAEGITYPSGNVQMKLISKFYKDINFNFENLGYIEAHATGTVVGDPEECKAIDQTICRNRNTPILVGSVKSNCGHTEASSGIVSLTKVLFICNNNIIPPNINLSTPRKAIEAIGQGRLVVVTEKTELAKPYVCINSFGFGGANAHALLKQYSNEHPAISYNDNLPYLLTWSGRTESNVNAVFDTIESRSLNLEYLSLMHSSQKGGIKGMIYRGYNILQHNNGLKPVSLSRSVKYNEGSKCPIVWVFSGMGSQWVGMGRDLMKINVCRQSIEKSHAVLKPHGIDLIDILTSENPNTFSNIIHCFVGITATQIALVDLLTTLEIEPDFIIGHSAGEVGCAYADGSLNAEQAILVSYYRGKVSNDVDKIRGSMAAVGLGYKDIKDIIPSTIAIACHNSPESSTISGPEDDVAKFVDTLKAKQIFAKEVPCSNIAYHSKYIEKFGPELQKYLKKVIPNPKTRSDKWISTCFSSDMWLSKDCKLCSAEYNVKNLLSSVLFEESATYLPKNSLSIEIAPHALLQSIVKSCNPDGIYVGLARRNVKDNVLHLLESLGQLYQHGCEFSLDKLYPPVKWPVPRGTPTISDLIEFDHSIDHTVYFYEDESVKTGNKIFKISPNNEHKYLLGHEIDGRPLIPATFYIESVWRAFSIMEGTLDFETVDVEFENVRFLRATTLSPKEQFQLLVSIQRGTGIFEITESKTPVVCGTIRKLPEKSQPTTVLRKSSKDAVNFNKEDFYKELKLRGYHYKDDFKSVEMICSDGSYGKIKWFNNWVTFMDCMLQISIVSNDSRNLALPVKLRSLRIHGNYHKQMYADNCEIETYLNGDRVIAGGIEIIDLKASHVQRRKPPGDPVLEKYQFIPNLHSARISTNDISKCCLQLYLDVNNSTQKLSIVQTIKLQENDISLFKSLIQAINDWPSIQGNFTLLNMSNMNNENFKSKFQEETNITFINTLDELESSADILLIDDNNISSELFNLDKKISSNAIILIKTNSSQIVENVNSIKNFNIIALYPSSDSAFSILVLLRNSPVEDSTKKEEIFIKISQYDDNLKWLDELKSVMKNNVILVAEKEPRNGLIGFLNCLRREPETKHIRCIFIDDMRAPDFDPNLPFYTNQLKLGLPMNIYRQGQWGTYRHLELKPTYPIIEHRNHICGAISNIGDFSSLHWEEGPSGNSDAKVRIAYSALNFRDVMHASGRLSAEDIGLKRLEQSHIFGLEYSGINELTKKPVMGMAAHSAIASHIETNTIISWDVPKHWTLREAATVPVVYTTVYYAFFYTVDIRTGKDILIHSGSGGVGIAAIRTAIAYGLEVYTTVSTEEKKQFLLKTFPQLKEENVGNSRDCSFEDMIRLRTNGRGVDFILNSLSEDKLKASLRCLAPNGHFLEIGKFDMANDSTIGLGVFFQGQSFHAILADKLEQYAPHLLGKIKQHIAKDIDNGIVQPLPSSIFKPSELEQAFRFLMTAKHIGKVLIEIRPDINSPTTYPIPVTPKMYFYKELVYIVPGGLGGFGLELVDWMILRGARKIILNSKRGLTDTYQRFRISIWNSYNCQIAVNTSDITTERGCLELLTESMKFGSIGGILNLAVMLKDGIFPNQTVETFQESLAPKAYATAYLDKLSRKLCPKLHCFIIFSSVSCGIGNAGQTNYGMANSIMERIIEERLSHGYPGKAIQWGAIGEVGLVAKLADGKIDLNIGGTLQQRISSCLDVLDTLLTTPDPIVCSMVVAEKKAVADSQTALQYVMNTLSLTQLKSISVSSSLSELGMDSLMGVEIKQTLERNFDIVLSPAELRALTIDRLKELSEKHKVKNVENKSDDNEDIFNMLESFYFNVTLKSSSMELIHSINNIDSKESPIIIFPGIEGICTKVWEQIGADLKAPAYVVQFLINFVSTDFVKNVSVTINNIKKFLESRGTKTFRIVAYSFGTYIAHMATKSLEKLGYTGSIVYIDGSPIWVQNIITQIKTMDDLNLKKRIILLTLKTVLEADDILHFNKLFANDESIETVFWNIKQNLKLENMDQCMKYLNSILYITDSLLNNDTLKLIEIIESKLLMISPTKLMQPNLDKFYGLKPIIRNVIEVATVEGEHQSVLYNTQISKLINQYFGITSN